MLKNFKSGYAVCGSDNTAKREKNDCVVRAIANACEVDYTQAHAFTKEVFDREDGKGTFMFNFIMKQLKEMKFDRVGQLNLFEDARVKKVKHIGDAPKLGGDLINPKYKHKKVAYTVKEFAQRFSKGNFIVAVKGHALAICNGVIVDNNNYQTTGYRRVVESAFQIS